MRAKPFIYGALAAILALASASEVLSVRVDGKQSLSLPVLNSQTGTIFSQEERKALVEGTVPRARIVGLQSKAKARVAEEPLDPGALWVLSLGQTADVQSRSLALAEWVSRRDAVVEFELLRLKATSGDLKASVRHLDRLLVVFPDFGAQALPGIATAIDSPEMREALLTHRARPWFVGLLYEAAKSAPSAQGLYSLANGSEALERDRPEGLLPTILLRLVRDGAVEQAQSLAERYAGLRTLGPVGFAPSSGNVQTEARPLSWALVRDDAAEAKLAERGTLMISIEPGRTSALLDRTTQFPEGPYQLTMAASVSEQAAFFSWELSCLEQGVATQIWTQSIPAKAELTDFRMNLNIPAQCKTQQWVLRGATTDLQMFADIQISDLKLLRLE